MGALHLDLRGCTQQIRSAQMQPALNLAPTSSVSATLHANARRTHFSCAPHLCPGLSLLLQERQAGHWRANWSSGVPGPGLNIRA